MSALFYVWDAEQHHFQTTISTLEQAEYFATNPQDLGFKLTKITNHAKKFF